MNEDGTAEDVAPKAPSPRSLRALGGAPPPALAGDLRAIERLPALVQERFWEVLEPNLAPQVDAQAIQATARFCEAHAIAMTDLAAPVGASRFLLRKAAEAGVSPDDLRSDVRALLRDETSVEGWIVDWYQKAKPILTFGGTSPQTPQARPPSAKAARPSALHTFGGGPPPPDLEEDLLLLASMPKEALVKFWQVLGPCLADELDADTEKLLDVFSAAYHVPGDVLARAIKASRFMIQSAAKLDVSEDQFGADLDRSCPGAPVVKEVLLAGYAHAKAQIRERILGAALADHGKLLVSAQWRLDTIEASEKGAKLKTPVAMLTLHYREGHEVGRVTLQVLPDMMAQLKDICHAVLP